MDPIEIESVEIVVPDPVGPLDGIDKYEDPLDEWMAANDIGEVGDGGTFMSDGDIGCVYFSAEVNNIELLPMLAEQLRKLGTPAGSKIHYIRGEYDVWNVS